MVVDGVVTENGVEEPIIDFVKLSAQRVFIQEALQSGMTYCTCFEIYGPGGFVVDSTRYGMFRGVYHGKQYHVADLGAVLARAWDAGVNRIIVTGGSLQESKEALEIAETDGRLFCTVGVHPTRCHEFEKSGDEDKHLQALLELAREGAAKGKIVAIGECGLDYDRLQFCPAETQRRYFEKQFHLAEVTGLPMFLHMRAASNDFLDIMERNKQRSDLSRQWCTLSQGLPMTEISFCK